MSILLFEDSKVWNLNPICLGRPAYAISSGGFRLIDLIKTLRIPLQGCVRPHLADIQRQEFPELAEFGTSDDVPQLLINARLTPSFQTIQCLQECLSRREPVTLRDGENLAAAIVTPETRELIQAADPSNVEGLIENATANLPTCSHDLQLFCDPHDIVQFHVNTIASNLGHHVASNSYHEIQPGVFSKSETKLAPHVVADATHGPIVLEERVSIEPFVLLQGPLLVGSHSCIKSHANVKDGVMLGHHCKIGGEIEASIIEPYSNKQHYGYLGHSYVGSWVNIGAGTSNSDLKNTYGTVRMQYAEQRVETGMQFMGCILGDYVKTAINTSIFTGQVVGAASMVYGTVTDNVPSFVNYARQLGKISELAADVVVTTQHRMFRRRKREPSAADKQLVLDMFEMTRHERGEMEGGPLRL